MLSALLAGLVLGFVGSIPAAGPLALLIVRAGLERRRARALGLAVGGAAAESVWASLALLSISHVGASLRVIGAVGAVVLIALGISMWKTPPPRPPADDSTPRQDRAHVVLGFVIVATNPGFLAAWTGFAVLLASVQRARGAPPAPVPAVAIGAFFGIVLWFVVLFGLASRLRERFTTTTLRRIVRVLAVAVIGFGVALLAQALWP